MPNDPSKIETLISPTKELDQLPQILKNDRDFSLVEGQQEEKTSVVERRGGKLAVLLPECKVVSAAASEKGAREVDEDAVAQFALGDPEKPYGTAYLLADGMGGEGSGDVAARNAIEKAKEKLQLMNLEGKEPEKVKDVFRKVIEVVAEENTAIMRDNENTTFCGAFVIGENIYTWGLGDSRVYLLRKDESLIRATDDQSVVESMVKSNQIVPRAVYTHPSRNVVGASFSPKNVANEKKVPGVRVWKREGVKRILLCCDGVWEGGDKPEHNFLTVDNQGNLALRQEESTSSNPDGGWIGETLRKENVVTAAKQLTAPKVGEKSGDNTSAIVVDISTIEPAPAVEEKEEVSPPKEAKPTFTEIVKDLIEPAENGKMVITDPALQRLSKEAMQFRNQTPEGLQRLLNRGSDWFLEGKISEEEWAILAGVIEKKMSEMPLTQAAIPLVSEGLMAEQFLKAAQAMEKAALQQREMTMESTYDIFVNAEYIQAPIRTDFDTFPPRWFREMSPEGQKLIRARTRLANAAFIKRRVAHIDPEAAKDNEFLILTREEAELMYKMKGVRETLETMFKKLFIGETFNGRYRLKLKEKEAKKLADSEKFKSVLRRFLLSKRVVDNETEATAAVAVAWNLVFTSNAIESADLEREVIPGPTYGEQIRAAMHPLIKARKKVLKEKDEEIGTEEGWGGLLGTWLAERVTHDEKFKKAFKEGQIKPFPETLFVSMFEATQLSDGETLAQKLIERKPINWHDSKMPAELFGAYADMWDTTLKAYFFTTGKKPLDARDTRPWSAELADIISKMRGGILKNEYTDPNFLFWCICSSVGLREYTSMPIIALPGGENYGAFLDNVLSPRLVDKKTKQIILAKFNEGFGGGLVRGLEDWRRAWRKSHGEKK